MLYLFIHVVFVLGEYQSDGIRTGLKRKKSNFRLCHFCLKSLFQISVSNLSFLFDDTSVQNGKRLPSNQHLAEFASSLACLCIVPLWSLVCVTSNNQRGLKTTVSWLKTHETRLNAESSIKEVGV